MSIYGDIGLKTNTAAASSTGASSATGIASSTLSQSQFLSLLTTQLAYQDPTKPVDNAQMVSRGANLDGQ